MIFNVYITLMFTTAVCYESNHRKKNKASAYTPTTRRTKFKLLVDIKHF